MDKQSTKSTSSVCEFFYLHLRMYAKLVDQVVHLDRKSLEIDGLYVLGHILTRGKIFKKKKTYNTVTEVPRLTTGPGC